MCSLTAASDRDWLEATASGEVDEQRTTTLKQRRDEMFRAIADAVQEAVESGEMEDYDIDRAVSYGRETANQARRETALYYRSLED